MRKEISSSEASAATLPSGYTGIRGGNVESMLQGTQLLGASFH